MRCWTIRRSSCRSGGSPTRPVTEHDETIRTFLAQIDPETGYIGDA
jgi:hypothetical protein